MNTSKRLFYATVGAGDLAVEKAKKAQEKLDLSKIREFAGTWSFDRVTDQYQVLVKRGEMTVKAIKNSAPTKRAAEQAKTARIRTKSAATSIKKAAEATVEATKEASQRVG